MKRRLAILLSLLAFATTEAHGKNDWTLIYPQFKREWSSDQDVYGLGLGVLGIEADNVVGLELALGISGTQDSTWGIQTGIVGAESRNIYGVQVGGLVALTESLYGVQVGGFITGTKTGCGITAASTLNMICPDTGPSRYPPGAFSGIQLAGLHNAVFDTTRFTGIQVAGLANVSTNVTDMVDIQIAGLFNFVFDTTDFFGVQIAGFVNATHERIAGLQLAGFGNIAKDITGMQIGLINAADELHGLQLGLWNRSRGHAVGQIGLVNTAEDLHGLQLGLWNRARGGAGVQIGLVNGFGPSDDTSWLPLINARF